MKQTNRFTRVISFLITAIMVVGMVPFAVFADAPMPSDMTALSDKETTLAPGITQNEIVILDKNGGRVEMFIATADMNVDTVGIQSSYVGAQCENYGMAKMTEQVAAHQAKYEARGEQYTAIVGMNGSYYNMTTGQPTGAFIMEGVDGKGANANNYPFFAILKDGTPYIGAKGEFNTMKDQIWETVGANEVLVWDGVNTYPSTDTAKYPRSAVGITADNKVIFINANGNKGTASVGLTRYELGQLFVELGCVRAVKYDEGGSATYVTKPQGSDTFQVTNTPSDGAERPVSAGLIIYSTAKGDGEFDTAVLTAENEYVTPESTVAISAIGADAVGGAAEIPADMTWQLADSKYGTISADGVFTSNGTTGEVKIQAVYKDSVVGETTVNVVIPDIAFANENTVVPYGKTVPFSVNATYDSIPVVLKDGDVVFNLSDAKLGTVNGSIFTACDASTGLTGGIVTATFKYDTTKTATTALVFGRGSEILLDFENDTDDDYIVQSFYIDRNTLGQTTGIGPAGRGAQGDAWIVDDTTGKVRNGDKALAYEFDNTYTTCAGYDAVCIHFDPVDITGATYIGMWVYVSVEEMDNMEITVYSSSTITNKQTTRQGIQLMKYPNFSAASVKPTEDGWYYFRAPVTNGMTQVSAILLGATDSNNTFWNPYNDTVIYIDDFTADFSDAVDDRENPTISEIYISETADSKVKMNGQTITQNTITVTAPAAENTGMVNATGLDTTSAKVYVDGIEITENITCSAEGNIVAENVELNDGIHTFRFEICDKAGNMGAIERQVVVNDEKGYVYFEIANPNAVLVPLGSIQYFNLVAENIETIKSVTTSIDLDSLTIWELKGMEVAEGFEATYTINDDFNTATITITRTGEVEATGETVLAAIPVRVWQSISWCSDYYTSKGVVSANPAWVDSYKIMTPYGMWMSDGTRMYRIEAQVTMGQITYVDDTTATFASDELHVLTEMNRYRADGHFDENWNWIKEDATTSVKEHRQGKISSHIHVAGAAQNLAATCTTAGYTGRIFCVECDCGAKENVYNATADVACQGHGGACGSVIDWGTIIPANGHNYSVVDGVLKCKCGKLFNGVYTDGKTYVDGVVIADGWTADNTMYYVDGVALTGAKLVDGVVCVFSDAGIYDADASAKYLGFVEDGDDLYYAQLGKLISGWQADEDGNYYYFQPDTYKAFEEGFLTVDGRTYEFADKIQIDGHWGWEGDDLYLYWAGARVPNGWRTIKGNKYFFLYGYSFTGVREVALTYNALETEWHLFDENGVWQRKLDGLYEGSYYIDGWKAPSYYGLVEFEGDYYYINNYAQIVRNTKKYLTKTNGLTFPDGTAIPNAYFEFDADGKMQYTLAEPEEPDTPVVPEEPEVLNGLVGDYYYIDGVRVGSYYGLVEHDGNFYYVNDGGRIVKDMRKYVTKTNGLTFSDGTAVPNAYFEFDADGKMQYTLAEPEEPDTPVVPEEPEVLNGLVGDYYYIDGVRVRPYYGLVEQDGAFYYINDGGKIVKNMRKYVTKTNGLTFSDGTAVPNAYFEFDADGKMIIG